MARGAPPDVFTVGRLLNEAQRFKSHKKYVAAFWRLAAKDLDGTMDALFACLQHVLLVAQVGHPCSRARLAEDPCGRVRV